MENFRTKQLTIFGHRPCSNLNDRHSFPVHEPQYVLKKLSSYYRTLKWWPSTYRLMTSILVFLKILLHGKGLFKMWPYCKYYKIFFLFLILFVPTILYQVWYFGMFLSRVIINLKCQVCHVPNPIQALSLLKMYTVKK